MPDVQYLYSIVENAIKNLVGVFHQRRDVHAGPLNDTRASLRLFARSCNDFVDTHLNRRRDHVAEGFAVC